MENFKTIITLDEAFKEFEEVNKTRQQYLELHQIKFSEYCDFLKALGYRIE